MLSEVVCEGVALPHREGQDSGGMPSGGGSLPRMYPAPHLPSAHSSQIASRRDGLLGLVLLQPAPPHQPSSSGCKLHI